MPSGHERVFAGSMPASVATAVLTLQGDDGYKASMSKTFIRDSRSVAASSRYGSEGGEGSSTRLSDHTLSGGRMAIRGLQDKTGWK